MKEEKQQTFQEAMEEVGWGKGGWGLGQEQKEGEDRYLGQVIGKSDDFEPDEKDFELFMEMMRSREVLPP